MSLDDIKETFFAECADQMAELETGLHEIQSSGPDIDTVNAVFRAVHSIKGGAGAFGFAALVSFAHVFENALDVIRNDLNQVNEDRMDLLLRSVDVLSDVIEAERTGSEPDDTSGLANDLETAFGLAEAAEDADDGDDALADFAPVMIDLADLGVAGTPAGGSFHISFAPHASLYLKGHDPLRFFRELADLGTLSVTCDTTDLPKLSELSPDESYLKWQIDLETESAREDIEAIFDWVDGECALSIEETGAPAADDGASLDAFLQSLDESDGGIADIDDFGRDPEMEPADAANPVADLIGSLEAADIGAPARQVEEQADAGNSDDGSEDAGARAGKKFTLVRCAAMDEDALTRRLFGPMLPEDTRLPAMEEARGGTLVLEDIEVLSDSAQARLLNAINDEGTPPETRIVAISNLQEEGRTCEQALRPDLYYRLAALKITVPPLRSRGEDILTLFTRLSESYAEEYGCDAPKGSAQEAAQLLQAPWPGNVRQLINLAERAVLQSRRGQGTIASLLMSDHDDMQPVMTTEGKPLKEYVEAFERMLIDNTMRRHKGSISAVMDELCLPRRTLNEKMAKYGLARADYL